MPVDLLPETGIGYQQLNVNLDNIPPDLPSPDQGSAKVCILDSGINTNHPLLRSAVAETSSFITDQNEFDDVGHGTAVAGIALYGDLEGCVDSNYWRPELWLYSGKLLYQDIETGEARFDEKTIEQSLIRAVKYFAGDLGCKIFNVSIGNANSPYDGRHVRGIAYVLDKLARDYDVLFVVSAGNFSGSSEPPVPQHSWRDEYPEYLMGEASVIIDPAPALNVITVGSIAKHTANYDEQRWPEEISALSPACEDQPSPFTRHGPSVKGAVKPDLVATGGNLATPMRREGRQWDGNYRGLGVLTLNHDYQGNLLLKEISGTSFAAPYITHLAGRLLNEYPESSANLLRAMLINHASLPDACANTFSADYQKQYKKDKGSKHRNLSREVVGYGKVDADTLYRSTENEVILKAEDRIKNDVHQFYELPLPTNFLRRQRVTRELRITLSYSPPVRTTRQDYTASKMFFRLVRGESLDEIQRSFNYKTKDDVAPRSDDVDDKRREITLQIRDKGTVQSSTWTFRELKPTQKWFVVVTRQDRDWGQSLCSEYEPYALVVSVADRDNESAQLYQQIRSEIQIQQQVRNRT